MRERRNATMAWVWAVSLALGMFGANCAQGQAKLSCGAPPELQTKAQDTEKIKGDLQGKAQLLSRFVGDASLSGKIEQEKISIYQSADTVSAAQQIAYVYYIFCSIILPDTTLSTPDKIKALTDFQDKMREPSKSGTTVEPDVSLSFVSAKWPLLKVVNLSDVTARQVLYAVAIWDMTNLDKQIHPNPLPIRAQTIDFIKPHHFSGPMDLFDQFVEPGIVKPGTRLFGSVSVDCADCVRGRTYWVYIEFGRGGWYAEIPGETSGEMMFPRTVSATAVRELEDTEINSIPAEQRITIPELQQ